MHEFIKIDLHEERLEDFRMLVFGDIDLLLEENLSSFYQNFLVRQENPVLLQEELRRIVQITFECQTQDICVLVDHWIEIQFTRLDESTIRYLRTLLGYLLYGFLNSKSRQLWINRFELEEAEWINRVPSNVLFHWFLFWVGKEYPALGSLLFPKEDAQLFIRSVKAVSLDQIIRYLPRNVLWNIGSYLRDRNQREIARELAIGKNIRKIKACPVRFSKKAAHYFANAPLNYTFGDAAWYGIIRSYGGGPLFEQVFKSVLGNVFMRKEFLEPVLCLLVPHGDQLDADSLQRVLGYLRHYWDEANAFTLKGWTMTSLQRRADEWYESLQVRARFVQIDNTYNSSWDSSGYHGFEKVQEETTYQVVELTSTHELAQEGAEMKHCVGTYAWKCMQHGTSIWSLRELTKSGTKSLVTIEVNKQGRIVQARSKCNGNPSIKYWELVNEWCTQEGLIR